MRQLPFDPAAKKRTVSVTLNSDLYAKARAQGINASRVAETALAEALAARLTDKVRAEIEQDLPPAMPTSTSMVRPPRCCATILPIATMQFDVFRNPLFLGG
jgi:hypothetical protein